jgi:hypothetical protein
MFCYAFVVGKGNGEHCKIWTYQPASTTILLWKWQKEMFSCMFIVDRFGSAGMWITAELPILVRDIEQLSQLLFFFTMPIIR